MTQATVTARGPLATVTAVDTVSGESWAAVFAGAFVAAFSWALSRPVTWPRLADGNGTKRRYMSRTTLSSPHRKRVLPDALHFATSGRDRWESRQ
jgi:hypothetical protein